MNVTKQQISSLLETRNIAYVLTTCDKIKSNLNVDISYKSVFTNHRGTKKHCRFEMSLHEKKNSKQQNYSLYCLFMQNERCSKFVFSGHQNSEKHYVIPKK